MYGLLGGIQPMFSLQAMRQQLPVTTFYSRGISFARQKCSLPRLGPALSALLS